MNQPPISTPTPNQPPTNTDIPWKEVLPERISSVARFHISTIRRLVNEAEPDTRQMIGLCERGPIPPEQSQASVELRRKLTLAVLALADALNRCNQRTQVQTPTELPTPAAPIT